MRAWPFGDGAIGIAFEEDGSATLTFFCSCPDGECLHERDDLDIEISPQDAGYIRHVLDREPI